MATRFAVIVCEDNAAWQGFYEGAYPAVFGDADDTWSFYHVRSQLPCRDGAAFGSVSMCARTHSLPST
jgi:hypothetical protein